MIVKFKHVVRDCFYQVRTIPEQVAFQLPYPLGRRWLEIWVDLPLVQSIFYRRERRWIRHFLGCLDGPVPSERRVLQAALTAHAIGTQVLRLINDRDLTDIAAYETAFGTRGSFWTPFGRAVRAVTRNDPGQHFVYSNLETFQQIDHGHGVILLTYHSPYARLSIPAILSLKPTSLFVLLYASIAETARTMVKHPNDEEAGTLAPRAIATHIQLAHAHLSDGGIVAMAGDGRVGRSTTVRLPVLGRWFPFKTGFAELAIQTGAAVMPMVIALEPDARVRITFQAPLDPGSENMPRAERVHSLVQQYAAFFEDVIRKAPETLSLGTMQSFRKHARVKDVEM